jgi:hypothetical protein
MWTSISIQRPAAFWIESGTGRRLLFRPKPWLRPGDQEVGWAGPGFNFGPILSKIFLLSIQLLFFVFHFLEKYIEFRQLAQIKILRKLGCEKILDN